MAWVCCLQDTCYQIRLPNDFVIKLHICLQKNFQSILQFLNFTFSFCFDFWNNFRVATLTKLVNNQTNFRIALEILKKLWICLKLYLLTKSYLLKTRALLFWPTGWRCAARSKAGLSYGAFSNLDCCYSTEVLRPK